MATKKRGVVNYMLNRELGVKQRIYRKSEDVAYSIGEEKATLPVKNQVNYFLYKLINLVAFMISYS